MCLPVSLLPQILEPRFTSETLALLLNIPPQKTLLRRHLATAFSALVGTQATQEKREYGNATGHVPLTTTAKVKVQIKTQTSTFCYLSFRSNNTYRQNDVFLWYSRRLMCGDYVWFKINSYTNLILFFSQRNWASPNSATWGRGNLMNRRIIFAPLTAEAWRWTGFPECPPQHSGASVPAWKDRPRNGSRPHPTARRTAPNNDSQTNTYSVWRPVRRHQLWTSMAVDQTKTSI